MLSKSRHDHIFQVIGQNVLSADLEHARTGIVC